MSCLADKVAAASTAEEKGEVLDVPTASEVWFAAAFTAEEKGEVLNAVIALEVCYS